MFVIKYLAHDTAMASHVGDPSSIRGPGRDFLKNKFWK